MKWQLKLTQKIVTVGRADLLTLDDARAQARKLLAEMISGFDPHLEKRNEKTNSITLIEVLEEYTLQLNN
ncbi:hypothetical protein BH10CYA1_BH10CYA1_40550 [soil metagenome]